MEIAIAIVIWMMVCGVSGYLVSLIVSTRRRWKREDIAWGWRDAQGRKLPGYPRGKG